MSKIRVTLKSPDAIHYAVMDYLDANYPDLDEEEFDYKKEELTDTLCEFFRGGEYLTVEVDLESKTIEVVK